MWITQGFTRLAALVAPPLYITALLDVLGYTERPVKTTHTRRTHFSPNSVLLGVLNAF